MEDKALGGIVDVVHDDDDERRHRQQQLRAPTARTGGAKSISKTRHFSSLREKVKTCFYLVEMNAQWFW